MVTYSEVAGMLLIDPLFEGLFLDEKRGGESADSSATKSTDNNTQLPKTWSEFWTKHLTSRWSGVWVSAVVGFNRLSLMLGLMSPVEDPKLNDMLPKEVILRKVSEVDAPDTHYTNYYAIGYLILKQVLVTTGVVNRPCRTLIIML